MSEDVQEAAKRKGLEVVTFISRLSGIEMQNFRSLVQIYSLAKLRKLATTCPPRAREFMRNAVSAKSIQILRAK